MTTIIERPSGDDSGGTAILGVILGIILAAIVAMVVFGVRFEQSPSKTTEITIETPSIPAPAKPN